MLFFVLYFSINLNQDDILNQEMNYLVNELVITGIWSSIDECLLSLIWDWLSQTENHLLKEYIFKIITNVP